MKSLVILDGDYLIFDATFGSRIVIIPAPPKISGSGHATIGETKMCIEGDEAKVQVAATYTTTTHTIPGSGIVSIKELKPGHLAQGCLSGEVLITKGQEPFTASFRPTILAMTPVGSPDVSLDSDGTGEFISSQKGVYAG